MIVLWRNRAERAYFAQLDFVRASNLAAARRLQAIVEHRLALLSRHPEMGRPGARPGTRDLVISDTPYLAVYQIAGQRIAILQFTSQQR